jgi:hypothetical protein
MRVFRSLDHGVEQKASHCATVIINNTKTQESSVGDIKSQVSKYTHNMFVENQLLFDSS